MIFGINDGSFFCQHKRFPENKDELNEVRDLGCNAIEMRLYSDSREVIEKLNIQRFEWRSIHIEKISLFEEDEYWEYLDYLDRLVKKKNILNVVFHKRWLKNLGDFKKYPNIPWSIENMAELDRDDCSVEDIENILNTYPNLRLTLDVRHALFVDPSGKMLWSFWNEFEEKISEIHISDGGREITPCFMARNPIMEDFLRINSKPVIIESRYADKNEMVKEIEYVKGFLTR